MTSSSRPGGHRQIWIQGSLGAIALGGLFFAPPASGRMLVVPVGTAAAARAPAMALGAGATLIGEGRLPGSLVVEGRRDALLRVALASGSLLLAANPAGCAQ